MTIRKGEEWGTRVTAPKEITQVGGDSDLALCNSVAVLALTKGDVFESLGRPQIVDPGAQCTLLEIDALQCEITLNDGRVKMDFAASCVEIGSFSPRFGRQSRYICVSNAGIVNGRNLTPRAHPNDGILDVLEVSQVMSVRNRLQAFKRASTGTHIPHPDISTTRGADYEIQNEGGREILRIDRVKISSWRRIRITVIPDYWKIVV